MMSAVVDRPWWTRTWDVVSDLLLATVVIWALPLLLAVVAGVIRLLLR